MAKGKIVDEKRAKEREAKVAEAAAIGKKKLDLAAKDDARQVADDTLVGNTKKKDEGEIKASFDAATAKGLGANVVLHDEHLKKLGGIMAAEKVIAEKSEADKAKITKDSKAATEKIFEDSRKLGDSRENDEWKQKDKWTDQLVNDRLLVDIKKEKQEQAFEGVKKAEVSKVYEDLAKANAAADEVEKR